MEITPEAAAIFAGLIALANAAVRLVERLVDGLLKKKDRNGRTEVLSYDTSVRMSQQVDDLWEAWWHNRDMPEQAKVWWSTAMVDMKKSIDRLSDSLEDNR